MPYPSIIAHTDKKIKTNLAKKSSSVSSTVLSPTGFRHYYSPSGDSDTAYAKKKWESCPGDIIRAFGYSLPMLPGRYCGIESWPVVTRTREIWSRSVLPDMLPILDMHTYTDTDTRTDRRTDTPSHTHTHSLNL